MGQAAAPVCTRCCASDRDEGNIRLDPAKIPPENPADFSTDSPNAFAWDSTASNGHKEQEEKRRSADNDIRSGADLSSGSQDVSGKADASAIKAAGSSEVRKMEIAEKDKQGQPQQEKAKVVATPPGHLFTVDVDTNNGRLGLNTDLDDGETLVVTALSPGLIEDWNSANPGRHIEVGDAIASVNDTSGSPSELLKILGSARLLRLTVRRHREYNAALLRKEPAAKLGIELRHREGGNTLLVRKVGDDGIVAEWNRHHSGLEIRVGDRVLEVNGFRGPGSQLNDKVKAKGSLIMAMSRFEPLSFEKT